MKNRKILVMRHAKSSWSDSGLKDFDRPLNKRGERDAPRMGRYLAEAGILPEQIVASPAARAKATILAVADAASLEPDVINWNEDLYFGSSGAYLEAIQGCSDMANVVMTIGHNPMTERLIYALSGDRFNEAVPTAAIACFSADVESWTELKPEDCTLEWFVKPKELN